MNIRRLEKQVEDLKDRKRKAIAARVFQETISQQEFEEMRDPLIAELTTAELNLSRARLDEIEVEKVVDFAENLLLDTAGVWQRCSLEQKQRLQQVLFPVGIEYADGVYRTQEMSF